MKIVEFSPVGEAFPDCKVEEIAMKFLMGPRDKIVVSTETFVTAVRVCVAEGAFPHDKVVFQYRDQQLKVGARGELMQWPYGFCHISEGLLHRLLNARFRK